MAYPKCAPSFQAFGCNICSPECPGGGVDTGSGCAKDTVDRTVSAMVCAPGQEQDGLLCYPQCDGGSSGVGPLCWQGSCESDAEHSTLRPVLCTFLRRLRFPHSRAGQAGLGHYAGGHIGRRVRRRLRSNARRGSHVLGDHRRRRGGRRGGRLAPLHGHHGRHVRQRIAMTLPTSTKTSTSSASDHGGCLAIHGHHGRHVRQRIAMTLPTSTKTSTSSASDHGGCLAIHGHHGRHVRPRAAPRVAPARSDDAAKFNKHIQLQVHQHFVGRAWPQVGLRRSGVRAMPRCACRIEGASPRAPACSTRSREVTGYILCCQDSTDIV
eukprot:TRINITY_DN1080_c0_g1_i2.p1 TRINITY_DN1080_c0_g1~~TRINITY_DN1080_c0_g1_i2.p1  ORF type:complete len:323 (-),score=34.68 TRINITY_DN1080_c0_g1_i2:411-1379(-)